MTTVERGRGRAYDRLVAQVLHVQEMTVNGARLEGHAHGGVLVPPSGDQWLVHVTTTRVVGLTVGEAYELLVATREGTEVEGTATLRRSDGQSHYFVGSPLPDTLA